MTDKLDIWNQVKRPPAEALKTIKGGRLTGMTDISPMWRYKKLTEVFGPCGDGWTYEIKRTWTENGPDGQVMAFAQVDLILSVYARGGGYEVHRIPGIGGSSLVAKESAGLRGSDEAYKMAVTDALSVAMKMLGVGADIYMGMWDGSKYKEDAAPTVKIDHKKKKEFAEQVRDCLQKGDEHGLKQLWAEWDTDEKVILWAMFNSQERSAMKSIGGDA